MKTTTQIFLTLPCLAAFLAMATPARAALISGVAFCNVSNAVSLSAPTSSTLATAELTGKECATFSASAIDFVANGSASNPYNLGGFLTGDGAASGITFLNGFTASSTLSTSSTSPGFLAVFTGTASFTHGQSFTVNHDDGTNMYVNGVLVVGDPGPTPPITTTVTYMGATGNLPFQFIYTECCGSPAVYKTTLVPPSSVPEPGSLALFGTGLLGLYGIARRRIGF